MNTRDIGQIGEEIATDYLRQCGFVIADRNYLKRWGELDIVAKKKGQIHFFEVKSVTADFDNSHKPENNVHGLKVRHLRNVIRSYLEENDPYLKSEFFVHILCVYMNMATRKAKIRWIRNIIL